MNIQHVNVLYQTLGRQILAEGVEVNTRGTKSKELICPQIVMDLNKAQVVTLAPRKLKPLYVIDEFLWYMSRSLQASDISKSAPFWDTLKDVNGNVVSNYGTWIFEQEDVSSAVSIRGEWMPRFDYCIDLLSADPDTRKAIINIHGVDNMAMNPKDTPCTLSLQFLIRNNKLNMVVNMRSNDFVIGFCNDVIQFQLIALMVYAILKFRKGMKDLKLGLYYHNAASMHIYEKHYGSPSFDKSVVGSADRWTPAVDFARELNLNLIQNMTSLPSMSYPPETAGNYDWLDLSFTAWFRTLRNQFAEDKTQQNKQPVPIPEDPLLISIPLDEGF